jgi:hypothetical protein
VIEKLQFAAVYESICSRQPSSRRLPREISNLFQITARTRLLTVAEIRGVMEQTICRLDKGRQLPLAQNLPSKTKINTMTRTRPSPPPP